MTASDSILINTNAFRMTEQEFFKFCNENRDLRIERDATQNIIIMAPTKRKTGARNAKLIYQLLLWNEKYNNGTVYDSSTAFRFKNKAVRSPDVAWVSNENPDKEGADDVDEFEECTPDFVMELKSKSDTVKGLKEKMEEYISNGVKLGYLIIPDTETIYIYENNKPVIVKDFSEKIIATTIVACFELDLKFMMKK